MLTGYTITLYTCMYVYFPGKPQHLVTMWGHVS